MLEGPDLAVGSSGGSSGGGDSPSVTLLDKESFHGLFIGVFTVAEIATRLTSLHVEASDDKARAASDAIYETIYDIPALHFMLQPSGKWLGRIACIGMFVAPMSLNVSAELAARGGSKKPSSRGELIVPDFDMKVTP